MSDGTNHKNFISREISKVYWRENRSRYESKSKIEYIIILNLGTLISCRILKNTLAKNNAIF